MPNSSSMMASPVAEGSGGCKSNCSDKIYGNFLLHWGTQIVA